MNDSDLIFGLMASFNKESYAIADLIHLTSPFGLTKTSLRTNLSRMKKKQILDSNKIGKKVFYRMSVKGNAISSNVAQSFKQLNWDNWDGKWWGIIFSVPEINKEARHKIRKKLTAYRFASLHPGFWIRPRNKNEKIEVKLKKVFEDNYCNVIIFDYFKEIEKKEIIKLWKLDKINDSFIEGLDLIHNKLKIIKNISLIEALKEKMVTGNTIIKILFADPLLPDIFLPDNWIGVELKKAFHDFDKIMTDISKPYWIKIFK